MRTVADFCVDTAAVQELAASEEVQRRCPLSRSSFPLSFPLSFPPREEIEWVANNYCVCRGNLFWAGHYSEMGDFWQNWRWIPSYKQLADLLTCPAREVRPCPTNSW